MLLHIRIKPTGLGTTMEAANKNLDASVLQKNRAIESVVDPSVDPSPDTRPSLTYCNRRVDFNKGEIEHIHQPLPEGATVCEACRASPSVPGDYDNLYILDEQTAAM
jgi:hypothetical protein